MPLNAPLEAPLKARQRAPFKAPKKSNSRAYFIAYHIARFSARHIASRIARFKAQRIASRIACLKAPTKARVKVLLKAQLKAHFKACFMASSNAPSKASPRATPICGFSATRQCLTDREQLSYARLAGVTKSSVLFALSLISKSTCALALTPTRARTTSRLMQGQIGPNPTSPSLLGTSSSGPDANPPSSDLGPLPGFLSPHSSVLSPSLASVFLPPCSAAARTLPCCRESAQKCSTPSRQGRRRWWRAG